ncbi:DUF2956 domain-containing protein [Ferrimonas sp. SCSIO 43195]|uniref:DUF2956 domain-containing protein n=1 Tax=Ferrimonas sp. SCSIO 43195 TaxID=2822844 RepID=UPI002075BCA6|nr:DUF2956 domain-containing protein [Ferrimonas sp. SCSIO 43195]USD37377.1 DUF2956 domain-containing protein [Ferrimonas sp. SCSIO 43195]
MKAKNQQAVSPQVVAQADKIAKATQKPGQTKEQTRLIAKGIEKGIAEYKKREKAKARERDKQKKREQRDKSQPEEAPVSMDTTSRQTALLPWILLGLSWAGFLTYLSMA